MRPYIFQRREQCIEMISPNEATARAKQKEDKNYAFRTLLKGHADPVELDKHRFSRILYAELHSFLYNTN